MNHTSAAIVEFFGEVEKSFDLLVWNAQTGDGIFQKKRKGKLLPH